MCGRGVCLCNPAEVRAESEKIRQLYLIRKECKKTNLVMSKERSTCTALRTASKSDSSPVSLIESDLLPSNDQDQTPQHDIEQHNVGNSDSIFWHKADQHTQSTSITPGSNITMLHESNFSHPEQQRTLGKKCDLNLSTVRWGFQNDRGTLQFNVRVETLCSKYLMSQQRIQKRCIVWLTGFIEWSRESIENRELTNQKKGSQRQPHYVYGNKKMLPFAAVWQSNHQHPNLPSECSLVTAQSSSHFSENVHHRSPIVFSTEEEVIRWLDRETDFSQLLQSISVVCANQHLSWHPIHPKFGCKKQKFFCDQNSDAHSELDVYVIPKKRTLDDMFERCSGKKIKQDDVKFLRHVANENLSVSGTKEQPIFLD